MTRSVDDGVSDVLGAVLLVVIVGMAVSLVGASILSEPLPQRVPALSADITTSGNTIQLRHTGGDPVAKSEVKILVDGVDLKNSFSMGGSNSWSVWSIGDTLSYVVPTGQTLPKNIQLVYMGTSSGQTIQSWSVPTPG